MEDVLGFSGDGIADDEDVVEADAVVEDAASEGVEEVKDEGLEDGAGKDFEDGDEGGTVWWKWGWRPTQSKNLMPFTEEELKQHNLLHHPLSIGVVSGGGAGLDGGDNDFRWRKERRR